MFAASKLMMGGKGPLKLITATSSGFATSAGGLSYPLPATILPGDLIVAVVAPSSSSARSVTAPAGWNEILDTNSSTYPNVAIYWRVAVAGDAGSNVSFTFSGNASNGAGAAVIVFRNAKFYTIGAVGTDASAPVAASINASKGISLAIFLNSTAGLTFTTPSGMTSATFLTTGVTMRVCREDVAGGATGTRTSSGSGPGTKLGVLLSVTRK